MQVVILSLIAALIGAGLIVQIGLNAQLRAALGAVSIASIVNFVVGLAALVVVAIATVPRWPGAAEAAAVPRLAWLSGLFGALYVAGSTVLGPKLGAVLFLSLTILGQVVASLLVDHYGVLSFQAQPISVQRMLGALLVVVGVVLVARA
jgi:transporter family-2 protein